MTTPSCLTWGKAGGAIMGLPDAGAVSAVLPDGGSVMISPHPHTGRVEMVRFTPAGDAVLLLTDAGSIADAQKMAETRLLDDIAKEAQR